MSDLIYPMLVSDIDGTIVTAAKEIPEENRQSIDAFRRRGGRFTLATGRSYREAKRFIHELKVDLPVILCNGGLIYEPASDQLHPVATLERKTVFELVEQLSRLTVDTDIFIYTLDKIYATGISPSTEAALEQGEGLSLELIPSYNDLPQVPWLKLVAVAEEEAMPHLHDWSKTYGDSLEFVQSSANYFEIMPKNISKGNALTKLARRFHLEPRQCAAIGDHLNDLSMIQIAGTNAAVANAHPHLIHAAKNLVPSNEEAGVSHFIRNHLLKTMPQAVE
ncbi:HAD family hydrolase [Paludifilum halophilum]|uniref:Hydrolase n=1 Tax=Paludifilum halophilum TaxID=1642702 RepID=A0A235B874_9BACL|nr:HAD family hydrolase [Paludifilum halophilum]OYD08510.1 hypothetical protein CHM34_06695 [Paludifilum halophilum]